MSERELILRITAKDFVITAIRGSGPGGQHRNKVSTGVRMVHPASGARAEASDNKSQHRNRTEAFRRIQQTPEWKAWFRVAVAEAMGRPSIAAMVDAAMDESNIVTEIHDERGRWVQANPTHLTGAP